MLLFVFGISRAFSQNTNYLKKEVTLTCENVSIKVVLNFISKQTGVQFAYTNFNDQEKISYTCKNKELKLVLNDLLLSSNSTYKQSNKYFIIKGGKGKEFIELPPNKPIRGYVYNFETNLPLANVSVFNRYNKEMIYSDENGIFKLNNNDRFNPYPLSIAKENYLDTNFLIYNPGEKSLTIYLHQIKKSKLQSISLKDSSALVQTDTFSYSPFAFFSDFWEKRK